MIKGMAFFSPVSRFFQVPFGEYLLQDPLKLSEVGNKKRGGYKKIFKVAGDIGG